MTVPRARKPGEFESKAGVNTDALTAESLIGADAMTAVMIEAMDGAAQRVGIAPRTGATGDVRPPVLSIAGRPAARRARVADVGAIAELIHAWADMGLTIRRSAGEILAAIDDFVVADFNGRVIACGALERCGGSCAHAGEIRSVAVASSARGLGVGRSIVDALMQVATGRGLDEVVLLTKTPAFFGACGFEVVESHAAPRGFVAERVERRGRTVLGRVIMRCATERLV